LRRSLRSGAEGWCEATPLELKDKGEEMKKQLTIETMGQLDDGAVGVVVNQLITDILKDCEERPGLDKKRKLTLELTVTPVLDKVRPVLKGVDIDTSVKATIPSQALRTAYCQANLQTATGKVEALLPDAYQDSIFDEPKENN
jgi:hypothetical protein